MRRCVPLALAVLLMPVASPAQESDLDAVGSPTRRPTRPSGPAADETAAPASDSTTTSSDDSDSAPPPHRAARTTPPADESDSTPAAEAPPPPHRTARTTPPPEQSDSAQAQDSPAPASPPATPPSTGAEQNDSATALLGAAAPAPTPAPAKKPRAAKKPRPAPPPVAPARSTSGSFDVPGAFGIGVTVQDSLLIGATLKFFLGGPWALQASAGFGAWPYVTAVSPYFGFESNLDLLYELPRVLANPDFSLNFYLGVGGTFGINTPCLADFYCSSSPYGGVQLVGGLGIQFRHVPAEAVFELRPALMFTPYGGDVSWFPGAAVAIRFFPF